MTRLDSRIHFRMNEIEKVIYIGIGLIYFEARGIESSDKLDNEEKRIWSYEK